MELTIDALEWLADYDTLVLFSGDSDFNALLKHVKVAGKQAVVCSMRYHVARELIESADFYLDVRKIEGDILKPAKRAP